MNARQRWNAPLTHRARAGVTGIVVLVTVVYLAIALAQLIPNWSRLHVNAIVLLLGVPMVLAAVVGTVAWLIFRRSATAWAIGWCTILILLSATRVLIMTGVITGSARKGTLAIASQPGPTPAPSASPSDAPAPSQAPAIQPTAPIPPPQPTAPAAPTPFPSSRDFAEVARHVAQGGTGAAPVPGVGAVLDRHASELASLLDAFAREAAPFVESLPGAPTIDPATLQDRVIRAEAARASAEAYASRARGLREALTADLASVVDQATARRLAGQFVTFSFAENRGFAATQVATAAGDLVEQYRLILDKPGAWSMGSDGMPTCADGTLAARYRALHGKLTAQKGMLAGAITRATNP
jgi:hypothetical protein